MTSTPYLASEFPQLRADVKSVFADGDFVVGHVHGIPEDAAHQNGTF